MKRGNLFVLSGPSGVGKGTVLDKLLANFDQVEYSISATTRKPRQGELNGRDYFFMEEEKFFEKVEKREFIEWAKVHNNYYGTPRDYVESILEKGKDIILEIDIQGAKQVRKTYPEAIFIFLTPPSLEELEQRLDRRGSEDDKNKAIRLKNARGELEEQRYYNYQIVNDKLMDAVIKLKSIIIAEKCRINKKGDE